MARKVYPVKVFNWRLEIDGLDTYECQTCNIPTPETDVIEHGAGNAKQKTAGMVNVGQLVFSKLKPMEGSDRMAWAWMEEAQNSATGNGNYPQFYERDVKVKLMAPNNEDTLYSWFCEGVWVSKIEYNELSKTTSENVLETVTCEVDTVTMDLPAA